MSKKLYFLMSFVLALGLSGAVQAEPIVINNYSFEYDINSVQITELTGWGAVKGWTLRDTTFGGGGMSGWQFVDDEWWDEGYEAADGNVCSFNVTADEPNDPNASCQIIQILDDANAIIAANRRYTLTFNALRIVTTDTPTVYGALFYSLGGVNVPPVNDVILASKETVLMSAPWGEPDYAGWEEVTLAYIALSGAGSIGERLGIKLSVPVEDPWLDGYQVVMDNVRLDYGWASGAYDLDPPDRAEDVNYLGVTLSWLPGVWAANDVNGHEVYFGTSWAEVNSATTASDPNIYRGTGVGVVSGPDGNDRYSYVIPGGDLPFVLGKTYYWRIDEVNENYSPGPNEPPIPPDYRWKGDVWSFTVEGQAKAVYPADRAVDIPALGLTIRWEAGVSAGSHDVYFGTSWGDVTDATTANTALFRGNQPLSDVNYPVEDLDVGEPYFWRIDEVNDITVKGNVWRFTTGVFLIVDSFEWYETNQELRAVWKDYWSGSLFGLNGAEIKLMTEADDANMVLGGEKSMEYAFRNRNAKGGSYVGSEARADAANLEIGSDWTIGGVKALVVNFYGDPCNLKHTYLDGGVHTDGIHQDQLWVAVNDVTGNEGVVQYPDMADIASASWHTWNISLIDPCFNGVDMNNVANVYIGFGGQKIGQTKKGTGSPGDTVYFDDIRLYPPRCMPSITGIDNLHALGDFTEDCNTDYFDLEIMVRDWMITDGDVLTENRPAVLTDFPDETSHWTTDCAVGTGAIEANEGWNIDVNDPRLFGLESMSITAWVKQTIDNSWVGVVSSRESYPGCGDDASELGIYGKPYGGPDGLGYDWSCGTEEWTFDAGLDVPIDGTWTFIALSVDPTGATLYMRPTGSALQTGARNTDAHDVQKNFADHFTIGSDDKGGYFVGKIDDVRIYAYDLDFNDVNNLAYQAAEPNPPPVYWYKFDETSGLSAADSGTPTTVYGLVLSPANLVPKDPNDSEDPNLGTNAFDPNNLDIINFLDYRIMAEHWLSGPFLWPARP